MTPPPPARRARSLRQRAHDLAVSWDLGGARAPERRSGAVIGVLQVPLRPILTLLARPTWIGRENLQVPGPAVVCGNHLGPFDAFAYGHLLHAAGIAPRFLAKESLFRIPVVGGLIRATGQIPVLRGTARSGGALAAARAALGRGEMLMVFPEGTYSRDPQGWPMRARLGAARLALDTGAPLIPVACWGSPQLWPAGSALPRPRPGRSLTLHVGAPIRAERAEGESTHDAAVRVTGHVMDVITAMLADLRQEQPPAQRHDPRLDPHRPEEGSPASRAVRRRIERRGIGRRDVGRRDAGRRDVGRRRSPLLRRSTFSTPPEER